MSRVFLLLAILLLTTHLLLASAGRGRNRERISGGRGGGRRKPPKSHDCERIKERICSGIGLPYNRTNLPNIFGHSKQKLASRGLQEYRQLIESACSPYIRIFLCASFFPECPRKKRNDPLQPCKSLCEKARRDCEPTLNEYGFPWPTELACDGLPGLRPGAKRPNCIDYQPPRPDYCRHYKDVGPCRTYRPFWYYDISENTCQPFTYGGCLGNNNRFPTKEECLRTCGNGNEETDQTTTIAQKMEVTTLVPTTTTVTASLAPVFISRPQDSMIAEGQGSTLRCRAEGAIEYTWARIDGAMPESKIVSEMVVAGEATLVLHNLTREDTGYYTCTAENEAGVIEATAKITVMAVPQITRMSKNITLIRGEPFELTCQATGSPQPRVTWERKDGKRALMRRNGTVALVVVESASTSDSGFYTCKATNSLGSTKSMIHVKVLVPPRWDEKPISRTVIQDDDVILRCNARGTEPLDITWRLENGENSSMSLNEHPRYSVDNETHSFKIQGVQLEDEEFIFHCDVTNEAGSLSTSAKIRVLEHWQLPKIASALPNTTAFVGNDVRMSCEASGDPVPQITWYLADLDITTIGDERFEISENGHHLLVKNVNMRDSGTYSCVAGNINGVKQERGELRVVEPSLRLTKGLANTTVENGSALKLVCAASGEPKPEVTWFYNDKPINITIAPYYVIDGGNLVVHEMTKRQEGKYGCLFSNEFFTVSSVAMVNISRESRMPSTVNEVSIPDNNPNIAVMDSSVEPHPDNSSCRPCPDPEACKDTQKGAIKPRRFDITDPGLEAYFRGWVDVTGQGAANDYCRVIISPTRGLDGSYQLACALAGTKGQSEYNYISGERFDVGQMDTWYMRDQDGDGRDDYCRCVSDAPGGQYVYCTKADAGGFHGAPGIGETQYSFRAPGDRRLLRKCRKRKVDPFIGLSTLHDN